MCMGSKPKAPPPPAAPPPPPTPVAPLENPETASGGDAANAAARGRRRISIANTASSGGSGLAS